jgi:hypothetical protein
LSVAAQKQKYIQVCHDARQTTVDRLSPCDGVPFTLTEWSGRAYEASKLWTDGYYDWVDIGRRYSDPDRLTLALWVDDRLIAMCLARTTSRAVFVEVVEGDAAVDCPFRGLRLEILLDACANYAQARGKLELQLQPKNDEMLAKFVREAQYRLTHSGKPLPEPEPAYGKSRPMTGLGLSADQRKRAKTFTGNISHGSVGFARKA